MGVDRHAALNYKVQMGLNGNGKTPKTLGEKVWIWTRSIVALATILAAFFANYRGGETWDVLKDKVDAQSQIINQQSAGIAVLRGKLDHFEAREQGRTEGKLAQQIVQLKAELKQTKAQKLARAASAGALRKLLEEQARKPKPAIIPKPKRGKRPMFQHVAPLPTSPLHHKK